LLTNPPDVDRTLKYTRTQTKTGNVLRRSEAFDKL